MALIFLRSIWIPLIFTICFKKGTSFLWNAYFFILILRFLDANLDITYLMYSLCWLNFPSVNIKMSSRYVIIYSFIISCNVLLTNS